MRLTLTVMKLRYATHKAVNELMESGKQPTRKHALLHIINKAHSKDIPTGFDHCRNPYQSYIQFIRKWE